MQHYSLTLRVIDPILEHDVLYTACELRILWYNDEVWCSLHGESLVIKGVISPIYRGYNSSYLFVRPFIGVPYSITPIYNWWRTHLVAWQLVRCFVSTFFHLS